MAKLCMFFFPVFGRATVFPDVLVPVFGQPKLPSDLIGTTMHVPSMRELDNHLSSLGANPSFTKHMEVFQGAEVMVHVTSQLHSEIGLAMSSEELFQCAQEPSCLEVWTTGNALIGKTIRITQIIGLWSMSETGVGNVCHVNADRNVAYCHVPSDAYKSGLSWLAMGVPVDMPLQEPLPVAVRCHDMGPNSHDAPCHLLSGNEFMAARIDRIDTHLQSGVRQIPASASNTTVVSLGWGPDYENVLHSGDMCLDVLGGACVNGAALQMWECNGYRNQNWFSTLFNPWAGGTQHQQIESGIHYDGTGIKRCCLDVPGGDVVEGMEMWIWECTYEENQKWFWSGAEEAPWQGQLKVEANPDFCLERSDIQGGRPFLAYCSDSESQWWRTEGTEGLWNNLAQPPLVV